MLLIVLPESVLDTATASTCIKLSDISWPVSSTLVTNKKWLESGKLSFPKNARFSAV